MNWIDKLNNELEERRNLNKTSESKEEAQQRKKKWIASQGGKAAGNLTKELGIGIHNEENRNEWAKMGGKAVGTIQGKKNIESGLISNLGKINASKIHECPHCSKIIQGRNYFKWHGDKCKHKK